MTATVDNLSAIADEHVGDEFVAKDVAATLATMAAEPFVNHVPTMMGGVGAGGMADFYDKYFIGHWQSTPRSFRSVAPPVPIVSSTR